MKPLFTATLVAALLSNTAATAGDITLLNSDEFAWERTPEGVSFAPLQGDRFAEAYQALVELPPGTISPRHVKSANMYGVMLQGEMIHYSSGATPQDAQRMGPGSYYAIPSGLAHVSACVSDDPCIAYLYQDGAFDFLPVQQ